MATQTVNKEAPHLESLKFESLLTTSFDGMSRPEGAYLNPVSQGIELFGGGHLVALWFNNPVSEVVGN